MASILSAAHFHNEEAAYAFVEARIWANGRPCPHCGVVDKSARLNGKSTRINVYKCYACRKPFTVKVGTIFESSHCKLHIWLQAMHFMSSGKKGVSANQLHRILGVSLQTAWFLAHRIREAMVELHIGEDGGPLGGRVRFPIQPASRARVDDIARTDQIVKGIVGKRLTYRTARRQAQA